MNKVNPLVFVVTALGLAAVGVAFGGLFAYIGAHAFGSGDFLALGLAIVGMLLGYAFGNVLGLILVKYALHQRGSVMLGIAAAVVWTGLSIGVAALLNLSSDASSWVVTAMFLLTPFAALLGFYVRRGEAS